MLLNQSPILSIKVILIKTVYLFVCLLFVFNQVATALPAEEKAAIDRNSVHYKLGSTEECSEQTSVASLSGDSNVAKAFNFLVGKGLTDYQAAGIIGNLIAESGVIPTRKQGQSETYIATMNDIREAIRLNKADSSSGFGIGIAQWTSWNRLENLVKSANGADPLTLEVQLPFLYKELGDNGLKELEKAGDIRQATWIFLSFFERPASVTGHTFQVNQPTSGAAKAALDDRVKNSQSVLSGKNTGQSESVSSTDTNSTGNTASCAAENTSAGASFIMGTVNVLHSKEGGNVDGTWPNRIVRTVKTIKDNNMDVVGMQEVKKDQWQRFKDTDMLGSDYDIYPTNYDAASANDTGAASNPIAYRKDMFELVDGKSIPGYNANAKKLDKAVIQVKLRYKSTGQEFYVMNMHEPVGNGDAIKARFDSIKEKIAQIKELRQKDDSPIFLTGDMNSKYTHEPKQATYQNDINNLPYCMLTADNLLWDAFDAEKKKTGKCPSQKEGRGVDHIYMDTSVQVNEYTYINKGSNAKNKEAFGTDHPIVFAKINIPGSGAKGDTTVPSFKANKKIKYDDAPSQCAGGQTAGAKSLSEVIMKQYSPPVTSVGGYSCRANTADSSSLSIHAAGRALDIMVNAGTPKGLETGNKIRNYLINNSEELGVQLVIWNRHIWSVNHDGWREYTGPNPHTDHVHAEINIAASKKSNLGK